jgi:hypothetical protein
MDENKQIIKIIWLVMNCILLVYAFVLFIIACLHRKKEKQVLIFK